MIISKWAYRKEVRFQLLVSSLLSCLYAIGLGTGAFAQNSGWRTSSSALTVAEVKSAGIVTTFSLRNSSGKGITAVEIALGASSSATYGIDYFPGRILMPGEACDFVVSDYNSADPTRVLRTVAVIYEDGSEEGLPDVLLFIRARRAGRMIESDRVASLLSVREHVTPTEADVELLSKAIGELPATPVAAMESFETMPATLPYYDLARSSLTRIKAAGNRSQDGFLVGVRLAREEAIRKVNALRVVSPPTGSTVQQERDRIVTSWSERYRNMNQKLHESGQLLREGGRGR